MANIQGPGSGGGKIPLIPKYSFNQSKYNKQAQEMFGGFTPYNPPSSSYYRDLGHQAYLRKEEEKKRKEAEKGKQLLDKYGISADEEGAFSVKSDDYSEEQTSSEKEDKGSLLNDILSPLKRFGQAINPFDDVSIREAIRGNVQDALKTERSGVTKEATRGLTRIANTGTLGTLDEAYKKSRGERASQFTNEDRSTGGKVADFAYDALGYLGPGILATGAIRGAGLGLKAGSKGAAKLGQLASEGALSGLGLTAAEVGIREGLNPNDYSAKDNLLHIGIGTGAGAVADPLLHGIGSLLKSKFGKVKGAELEKEILALPAPKQKEKLNEILALPEPQLRLEAPKKDPLDILRNFNKKPSGLENPIPAMPDRLRQMVHQEKLQNQGLNFGYNTRNTPKSRPLAPLESKLDNRPQEYWQNRYEDFVKHVNSNYDTNRLSEEALDDLWSQFAKYDEPFKLTQVVDLAYPKGYEPPPVPKPEIKPKPTLKDDLKADQRINELVKGLYPPQRPISRLATVDESFKEIERLAGPKPEIVEPQPLSFKKEVLKINKPLNLKDKQPITPMKAIDAVKQTNGNSDSFRAKIDRKPQNKENVLFSNLRTQFVDDVAPLEVLEKKIAGKVGSAENSLYKQARLYKGSPEKAHQIVKEQLYPIINDVQKKGYTLQDLGDYALAVHAKDVNAKGINSGFTNAEIEDVIKKFGTPEMESARKNLVAVNNSVLDILSDGSIVEPSAVKAMREKYPNYVSLFRSFDDDKIDFANGISKALGNVTNPIKKLEGSSRDVIDPMESVIKNIFKAVSTVDRNSVAKQLGKLADQDVEGNFIRRLPDNEDTSRLNVISAMENGKKVKYEVPPEVYRTMMNIDKESTNTLIKILQKPASLLRSGATLTPEFSLRNPLRDVPNAFVVSNSGFNPIVDFPIGLWQSIWKGRTIKIGNKEFKTAGDLYKQFIKENGGYGNIVSMDRKLHQETLKKALTEANDHYVDVLDPKTYFEVIKKLSNPINTLRTIADVSESATKVGEFRAALRKGVTPQEAAYRARDIMDFGRAGVSIREANKVVAFLNANIQGKSKLWRAFKENPIGVIGKASAAVTIPTIGAIVAQNTYANEKQKEIINDAPQYLKDTFWLIPIPGTEQIARIPKPFDLSFAFSNTLERAFDYVAKHDKKAFDGFIREGISQMAVPVMLTGIAPIVEGMANYSFFRQGPIIPEREKDIDFPQQYDVNTSETARLLGKGINKLTGGTGAFKNFGSPRVIDNSIQGFAGGLGTYATSVVDLFLPDSDNIDKPSKNLYQQPLAKAFLVNQSTSGKSLDQLYTLREKLTKENNTAKQNGKDFNKKYQYELVKDYTKEISEINKVIRTVENSSDISGDRKREYLDRLIQQRNIMAREAMEKLKSME